MKSIIKLLLAPKKLTLENATEIENLEDIVCKITRGEDVFETDRIKGPELEWSNEFMVEVDEEKPGECKVRIFGKNENLIGAGSLKLEGNLNSDEMTMELELKENEKTVGNLTMVLKKIDDSKDENVPLKEEEDQAM